MSKPQPGQVTIAFLTPAHPAGWDITYVQAPAGTTPDSFSSMPDPGPLPLDPQAADAMLGPDGHTRHGEWTQVDERTWACTVRHLDPQADMTQRWVADLAAVKVAAAALTAAGNATLLAAVPMYFPGKEQGFWTAGQEVVTLHGIVFIGHNGTPPAGSPYPDYSQARDQAAHAAWTVLAAASADGRCHGTAGWATVYPDGEWHVIEDIL
jgi:hypothetical protein